MAARNEISMDLKSVIRTIPDYPKKGIMFRDITTLLTDARGFRRADVRPRAAVMTCDGASGRRVVVEAHAGGDQVADLTGLAPQLSRPIGAHVYDGDTPGDVRRMIRDEADIVVTEETARRLREAEAASGVLSNAKVVVIVRPDVGGVESRRLPSGAPGVVLTSLR